MDVVGVVGAAVAWDCVAFVAFDPVGTAAAACSCGWRMHSGCRNGA